MALLGILPSSAEPKGQEAWIYTVMEASICPGKLFYCKLLSTPAVWNIVIVLNRPSWLKSESVYNCLFFEPVRKSIRIYSVVAPPSPTPHSTNHSAQLTTGSSFFIYIRFWEVFCSMVRRCVSKDRVTCLSRESFLNFFFLISQRCCHVVVFHLSQWHRVFPESSSPKPPKITLGSFRNFRKFAEIFASEGAPPERHRWQILPPVPLVWLIIPVANLPLLVSTIPAAISDGWHLKVNLKVFKK